MAIDQSLIRKYNVPGPRYTSYPTVPYWDSAAPAITDWQARAQATFEATNANSGISLYIHLPFCEKLCTFCGCNKRITVNHKVETPYVDSVLKEFALYLQFLGEKPRIKEIHLGGGTPTFFAPEELERLLTGILEQTVPVEDFEFGFEAHPNVTKESHIATLARLGFTRVSFGVQDFDPKVQDIINRHQSYEITKEVSDIARDYGYDSLNFDLVFGLPLQTKDSIIDTIEKVKTVLPERIAFYSYAHVPWVSKAQRRYTEDDLPLGEEKRQLYELGRELLEEVGYKEIGMDHFALADDELYKAFQEKRLHRNFMGYTPNYTGLMIGLGMSSISDCWSGFIQNNKEVEEYQSIVEKGEIPILRGHLLNEEDLILRRHILNIMCHFETDWSDPQWQHPSLLAGIERMKEMEADGLVQLQSNRLEVTEPGKTFIRNICMTLDARLWRNKPETQLFSQII